MTAEIYAGVASGEGEENGFMAHTQNTPFGWTCPGWDFSWGWSPAAVPWILQNCWEYYEFTGDTEYMAKYIYPMLKEEAKLYDAMLIEDEDGKLISSPTFSPEQGPRTAGNTYEQSLIWQLYEDAAKAADILGVDKALRNQWKENQANLKGPIEIGDSGQIKEWYIEKEFNKDENGNNLGEGFGHRHISHMLGLYPGDLIAQKQEWLDASVVTMNNRTDASVGWGMGQRIAIWARLGDGNRAYKLITDLFKNGVYQNMWDKCPPFQIDGNFGYTSGVAEMLLQSNMGYINLLPALPDVWANGSVNGLVARGNFEVDMTWENSALTEATLLSKNGGTATVKATNASYATVKDSDGNVVDFVAKDNDMIQFETESGKTYTISGMPKETIIPAPTSLEAARMDEESADLVWDAVESNEDVYYNVYRQVEDGDVLRIATEIREAAYKDVTAFEALGSMKYQVSVVINGVESKLSDAVSVKDLRETLGMIDDTDERIVYDGSWVFWGGDANNYNGSTTCLVRTDGTATLEFEGTGIEVLVFRDNNRGKFEVSIDGEVVGEADTNGTRMNQAVVFRKDDLKDGKHTIKLSTTKNNKSIDLDGFRVLTKDSIKKPAEVKVTSKSGMTTIAKANSTLQMNAEVLPVEAKNKKVTWSVSDKNLAEIDANGLLTVKDRNGVVTVKATAAGNKSVVGTMDITISIAQDAKENETVIEDGFMPESGNVGTKNPEITWSGDDWSTWAGEANRHHGGTKTEVKGAGKYFEYTFTGTGVEIYTQKHRNFASFDVSLDGKTENKSLDTVDGAVNGNDQHLLVSYKGLENTEHTIRCTIRDREGQGINPAFANLDYIKVFTPSDEVVVDKSALQEVIAEAAEKVEIGYTEDSWKVFEEKYNAAVEVMNDAEATVEEVEAAKAALEEAMKALVDVEVEAPELPEDAKITVMHVETTKFAVKWTEVPGTVKYKVTCGAFEAETTDLFYTFTGLEAGTEYEIDVVAVGPTGVEAKPMVANVITNAIPDTEGPGEVTNVKKEFAVRNSLKLSWTAPADEDLAGYEIWMDGQLVKTIKDKAETNCTIKDLTVGNTYVFKIVAFDEAGNKSVPVQFAIVFENENENITSVVNPVGISVKYGTKFADLPLPEKVTVNYNTGMTEDLTVNWSEAEYDGTIANTYVLTGEIELPKGVTNPDKLTAQIKVTVEPKESKPVDPENPGTDDPTQPAKPGKPGAVPTGDNGNVMTTVIILAIAVVAIGAVIVVKKKNHNR